ncbi:MAG: transcription termination factor NusA, partial [Thermodesulfobacteriota bacterium]
MIIQDVKRVVEQVSRDKGIDKDTLVKALEEAIKSAARKRYGAAIDIETMYDENTGEIEIFQFKEVVETVEDEDLQINFKEGRALDPECELGDSLGVKMDTESFGRIAAQSAKQVIIQKIREAERSAVYKNFLEKEGEIINGIVSRIERGNVIVNIGEAEAILNTREQIPGESYRRGDRVRANVMKVLEETAGPQIILSRAHADFVVNLFKTEVPEISEGIIAIKAIAREAGGRTKIAVVSNDTDIDPVGACVGVRGNRIQNVVKELKGEKIDIVPWNPDPARFVCNALSPAEISRVIIDEDNASMEIVVPDESHSLAIGRRGQNVRLASKLTGWHLEVQSASIYTQAMERGYDSLLRIPGVDRPMANALCEMGFFSAEDISRAAIEDLLELEGVDEAVARSLIQEAARVAAEPPAESADSRESAADTKKASSPEDTPQQDGPEP